MTPSSRGSLPRAPLAHRKRSSHVRHEHLPPAGQGGQRAEPAGEEHTVNKFPIFNNNSCSNWFEFEIQKSLRDALDRKNLRNQEKEEAKKQAAAASSSGGKDNYKVENESGKVGKIKKKTYSAE